MASTKNPAGFDVDVFSPPTSYREVGADELVELFGGVHEEVLEAYRFTGRTFVELDPYPEPE